MILDGKKVKEHVLEQLKQEISSLRDRKPGLAFILIGDHAASHIYVKMKQKACEKIGMNSHVFHLPSSVSNTSVLQLIRKLNLDETIDGIIVQMPLPDHLCNFSIMSAISPDKDVDGFHPTNLGKLLIGEDLFMIPSTPLGILTLLKYYQIPIQGKHVVIVGRSVIVSKPLALLFLRKEKEGNATVTVCHTHTKNLKQMTQEADLLIAALGIPKFITKDMLKKETIVIDVGINRTEQGIVGDVDYENVLPFIQAITPVPGGVGPMTIAMLLSNTWKSYKKNHDIKK